VARRRRGATGNVAGRHLRPGRNRQHGWRRSDARHDISQRRPLDRPDGGRQLGSLAPGKVEEPRQHLDGVLGREHLREPEFPVEELGHGIVLSREELGQAICKHARVAHPFSVARDPGDPAA